MPFYSATGKLITKDDVKPEKVSLKETIEYKADGTLVVEKDEKEVSIQPSLGWTPHFTPIPIYKSTRSSIESKKVSSEEE